jgi:prepilin-type N-terminal cleavage/methylation domain-containing protein
MKRRAGFTLIELLVVISIIVLLLALLLPALMGARRSVRQNQNATRMKSLYDGMRTYAGGNRDQFPGLDSQGNIVPAADIGLPTDPPNQDGATPVARIALLFRGGFIQPEDAINPIDSAVTPYRPGGGGAGTAVSIKTVGNFSYAMLRFGTAAQTGRSLAWSRDVNARAILLSDRNTGSGNGSTGLPKISSVWEEFDGGNWTGNIAWGDGRVTFDTTHIRSTQYPTSAAVTENDNLFDNDQSANGGQQSDAGMIYHILSGNPYIAQRPPP